jgi:hypothetical protein
VAKKVRALHDPFAAEQRSRRDTRRCGSGLFRRL